MVTLELLIPKTEYFPGDEINGTVSLACDKKTECKSFTIVFEGIMTAKASGYEVVGKGRTKKMIYTETFDLLKEEISLGQDTAFDPGTQDFQIQFKLPEDAKPSFEGRHCSVIYTVTASMDVSWRTKPKASKPITVIRAAKDYPEYLNEAAQGFAEHIEDKVLEIEIDSQKYCIGSKISFRYRVTTDMEFNNLRVRVEHIENSILKEKLPLTHTEVLWEEKIPAGEVKRLEWNEWTLNINKEFPMWLKYENVQSFLNLQMTLGRSFRLDKSAEVGLAAGYCSEIAESSESIMDRRVPEKRPRPKRLRCKTCSYSFKVKEDDIDFGTCPSCGNQIPF
ncbi:MAG: hypothetical protein ACW99G_19000 [Candidatus Thorarchaeota archaeon]